MTTQQKSPNFRTYWFCVMMGFAIINISLNAVHANEDLQQKMQDPANWASWGGDYQGTRYSKLDQINTKNVHQLQIAWMQPTGIQGNHAGGPLVVGDTLYIHTPFPNKVMAINQHDQSIKWVYQSSQSGKRILPLIHNIETGMMVRDGASNSGLAYGDGKIFINQADTTLVAIDAQSGKKVWSSKNGDPKLGATASSVPLVLNDKVIVGISGDDFGVRGYLSAYNITDGALAWRGYSTGPDKEMLIDPEKTQTWTDGKMRPVGQNSSLDSWQDEQWKMGGGTTSGWLTYDPKLNLIYYGTGSPAPWNPVQRPGDNRWTSALWARDADTGEVKWVYQMTPHDEWGYGGINESILLDQTIDGKEHQTLVHFDKNGFVYQLNRATGELLSAEKVDNSVNWAAHVDAATGRPQLNDTYSPELSGEVTTTKVCPTVSSSNTLQAAAYSPRTQLIYSAGDYICRLGAKDELWKNKLWVLTYGRANEKRRGWMLPDYINPLSAWDINTHREKWRVEEPYSILSGVLATAGDVVFYGTLAGYLKAVDATTGQELYQFKTPSGILGNITTWSFSGRQYIGVLSGGGKPYYRGPPNCIKHDHEYPYFTEDYLKVFRQSLCHQNQTGLLMVFSLPN